MAKYKTGDITVDSNAVRLYVVEDGITGYFHFTEDSPAAFLFRADSSGLLEKTTAEPVVCSLDDLLHAVLQTYGKEIR